MIPTQTGISLLITYVSFTAAFFIFLLFQALKETYKEWSYKKQADIPFDKFYDSTYDSTIYRTKKVTNWKKIIEDEK